MKFHDIMGASHLKYPYPVPLYSSGKIKEQEKGKNNYLQQLVVKTLRVHLLIGVDKGNVGNFSSKTYWILGL